MIKGSRNLPMIAKSYQTFTYPQQPISYFIRYYCYICEYKYFGLISKLYSIYCISNMKSNERNSQYNGKFESIYFMLGAA